MTGICTEFDDNKGYGRITGEDNKTYFIHGSAIQADSFHLDVGAKVSFEVAQSKRGFCAVMVKII